MEWSDLKSTEWTLFFSKDPLNSICCIHSVMWMDELLTIVDNMITVNDKETTKTSKDFQIHDVTDFLYFSPLFLPFRRGTRK